jgi:hypothetical protein
MKTSVQRWWNDTCGKKKRSSGRKTYSSATLSTTKQTLAWNSMQMPDINLVAREDFAYKSSWKQFLSSTKKWMRW